MHACAYTLTLSHTCIHTHQDDLSRRVWQLHWVGHPVLMWQLAAEQEPCEAGHIWQWSRGRRCRSGVQNGASGRRDVEVDRSARQFGAARRKKQNQGSMPKWHCLTVLNATFAVRRPGECPYSLCSQPCLSRNLTWCLILKIPQRQQSYKPPGPMRILCQ